MLAVITHAASGDVQTQIDQVKIELSAIVVTLSNLNAVERYTGAYSSRAIRALQFFLREYDYLHDFSEGRFDAPTLNALHNFQRDYRIPQTNSLDDVTRRALTQKARIEVSQRITDTRIRLLQIVKALQSQELAQYQIKPKPHYDLNEIAYAIHQEINKKRSESGLPALAWNEVLLSIAVDHSQYQARNSSDFVDESRACSYPLISHENFDLSKGYTIGDRLRLRNFPFLIAGENIIAIPLDKNWAYRITQNSSEIKCPDVTTYSLESAPYEEKLPQYQKAREARVLALNSVAPSEWVNKDWKMAQDVAEESVREWMNSEGHRNNILNSEFRITGIGIAMVAHYLIMTQVFVK